MGLAVAMPPAEPAVAPPPPDRYEPSETHKFLLARLEERMQAPTGQANRWALERMWFENILFYTGVQWLDWNPGQRVFTPMKAPRWFPRPVTNEIFPRAERLFAQFLKGKPAARVRPNSNDPGDRAAARAGEYLLAHVDDVVNEVFLRHYAAVSVTLMGTVISREFYDPTRGPIVEYPQTQLAEHPITSPAAVCPACGYEAEAQAVGQPCPRCTAEQASAGMMGEMPAPAPTLEPGNAAMRGPDGQPLTELASEPVLDEQGKPVVDRFHQGEIRSEVILPLSFYADENAATLADCQWAGHTAYKSLAWIRKTFPEFGRFVTESTDVGAHSFYQSALLSMVGQAFPETSSPGNRMTGGAVVRYYEERASDEFPDGLAIIEAGNVILWYGPAPIGEELSYSLMVYSIVPGRLWGTTPIEQLVTLQRRVNGIDAQIALNRKTMLNPIWLIPKGSGIKPGAIQHRPGLQVPYNAHGANGAKPEPLPGTALPGQIVEERSMMLDAMERISATQDVLRGDVPSGVKSGVALNYLGESAETTHLPRMQRWEQWIAERGRKRLLLAKKHYRDARMVKILGQGSSWQVLHLQGADLRDNTDVVVEAGSALPRSRTAQIQLIFDALETGIIGDITADPLLRQKVQEALGLTGFEGDAGVDYQRAQMENALMDLGELPEVGEYENLEIHVRVHTDEIKNPRFEDKTPEARQAYFHHLTATRRKWLMEQQRQLLARVMLGEDTTVPPGAEGPAEPAAPSAPPAAA